MESSSATAICRDRGAAKATIGIEDAAGTAAFEFAFDAPIPGRTAVRFRASDAPALVGTVTSAVDGLPIGGSLVTLGDRKIAPAPDASFRIAAWPGTYEAEASAPGYTSL